MSNYIPETFRKSDISLNFEKCEFFTNAITYLSHVLKHGKLQIQESHTKCLTEAEPPKMVTSLRSVLRAY